MLGICSTLPLISVDNQGYERIIIENISATPSFIYLFRPVSFTAAEPRNFRRRAVSQASDGDGGGAGDKQASTSRRHPRVAPGDDMLEIDAWHRRRPLSIERCRKERRRDYADEFDGASFRFIYAARANRQSSPAFILAPIPS